MKSLEYGEEIIQEVLEYIEIESEFWDEDFLISTGWPGVCQLVQEAVCKFFFMQMHEETRLKIPGVDLWSEEDMIGYSKWFYYDCIQYGLEKNKTEDYGEIDYNEFYDNFINFIKKIGNIRINDEMKVEFQQLIELLGAVEFEVEDKLFEKTTEQKISRRYVMLEKEGEIDVEMQTKRFWVKWIVGNNSVKNITNDILKLKKMKKQELVIWMLIAAIYNFSNEFGDKYLKNLKSILSYTHNVEEKNISSVLCWCFRCWEGMVYYADDIADFIKHEYFYGIVSVSDRFHYIHAICKYYVREELTALWNMKNKSFTNGYIFTSLFKMKYSSPDTELPFIGKMKKNGEFSNDDRNIARYVKAIWPELKVEKWLLKKNYFEDKPYTSEVHGDDEYINDFLVNTFIAYEFILLEFEYRKHFEYWGFHFMIIALMFCIQLIEMIDSTNECLEEFAKCSFGNKEWSGFFDSERDFVSNQIWGETKRLISLYNDLLHEEKLKIFWNIVQEIFMRGRIKISDILWKRLFQNIQYGDFDLQKDGYISCKMPFEQSGIYLDTCLAIYCLEFEYNLE